VGRCWEGAMATLGVIGVNRGNSKAIKYVAVDVVVVPN
jgi:hypothetical protein